MTNIHLGDACLICVATRGLSFADLKNLAQNAEERLQHLETVHGLKRGACKKHKVDGGTDSLCLKCVREHIDDLRKKPNA